MEGAYELDPPLMVDVGVGDELAGGEVSVAWTARCVAALRDGRGRRR